MRATPTSSPADLLQQAADVASFYGFRPLRDVEKRIPGFERRAHTFDTAAATCVQCVALHPEEPAQVFWTSPSPLHIPSHIERPREIGEFGLNIIGVQESIAEIVLLKTIVTILDEWGAPVSRIRINALGDRDSKNRFEREAATYLRKHQHSLHTECKEKALTDALAPYRCTEESCRGLVQNGPRAMNFLSEKSRGHFKQLLELAEKLSLPYEFDDLLMGDSREPKMLFAFDLATPHEVVVASAGGRYDDHFRTHSPKNDIGGVSASIYFKKGAMRASDFKLTPSAVTPSVYFVQLGLRAKIQGLSVVDTLRRAHIPLLQSFDSSKLTSQLTAARAAGVSHLLIMGQREALDNTVLVRSMSDSSQTIVGLSELPRYLKTLR